MWAGRGGELSEGGRARSWLTLALSSVIVQRHADYDLMLIFKEFEPAQELYSHRLDLVISVLIRSS